MVAPPASTVEARPREVDPRTRSIGECPRGPCQRPRATVAVKRLSTIDGTTRSPSSSHRDPRPMAGNAPTPLTARNVATLHAAMLIGLSVLAVVLIGVLPSLGGMRARVLYPTAGIIVVGIGGALLALALLVLRRSIPTRGVEDEAGFWAGRAGANAIIFWFVTESAGMLGAVGFMLSARIEAILVAGVAIATLAVFSPRRLAKR